MANKEILKNIYNEWSDEHLLVEYAKKDDYTEDAIGVMKELLEERNLLEQAEKNEQIVQDYKVTDISSTQIREEPKESFDYGDGVLYEKIVAKGATSTFTGILLGLALSGLVVLVVFYFAGMDEEAVYWWVSVPSILCLIGAILLLRNNKVYMKMDKTGRQASLEIALKNEVIEFTSPFDYFCCWQLIHHQYKGVNVKRPNLYIYLKHPTGSTIALHEDKTPQSAYPTDWELMTDDYDRYKYDLRITQHGMKKIELEKLKYLLDKINNKDA